MSSALQTCADRIAAALEYLTHEPDHLRAIELARVQLQYAQVSLSVGRGEAPTRRGEDAPVRFSPATPLETIETSDGDARSFSEVRGRLAVAECEALLEQLP